MEEHLFLLCVLGILAIMCLANWFKDRRKLTIKTQIYQTKNQDLSEEYYTNVDSWPGAAHSIMD